MEDIQNDRHSLEEHLQQNPVWIQPEPPNRGLFTALKAHRLPSRTRNETSALWHSEKPANIKSKINLQLWRVYDTSSPSLQAYRADGIGGGGAQPRVRRPGARRGGPIRVDLQMQVRRSRSSLTGGCGCSAAPTSRVVRGMPSSNA